MPLSRIRLLPETTVNRIAAGEVIERPAAALKELVENALDAGATRITVCLDGGGIDRLEVTDDGIGMSATELGLCVRRHATSKLADETLLRITTLGFRGEALPAIGAAARLRITSRSRLPPNQRDPGAAATGSPEPDQADPAQMGPGQVGAGQVGAGQVGAGRVGAGRVGADQAGGVAGAAADHASTISVEGGRVSAVTPAAGAAGTRVVVRDLFFATPARRKFLKSARVEAEHAEAAVRRLALAAPAVAFRLELDGRVAFEAPAQSRLQRVAALLGAEAAAAMLALDETRGDLRLSGYACSPALTRATPAAQALIVNHRPVADPVLRTAVKLAYRDVVAPGRHAVVALYLDLPAEQLDVNVHPAKTELRFRDAGAVRALVIGSVRRALGMAAGSAIGMAASAWSGASGWSGGGRPARPIYPAPAVPADNGGDGLPAMIDRAMIDRAMIDRAAPGGGHAGLAEAQLGLLAAPAARQIAAAAPLPEHPLGAPVAQVLDTYVIAVASDGALVLVDQHAAHERLTHEAIRAQLLAGTVRSQPLLLPAVVDLAAADVARLAGRAAELGRLGLDLEAFGVGAILVRALPAVLGPAEPGPLLRDLADEFAAFDEQTVLSARLDAVIARMACHGSIRAGRKLAPAEMNALLRAMEATPRASTCSHGRPTVLKLSRLDLEKLFGRR
ncbi:DNA mismatch repair endonuclease MutL [Rhodopila sp.]|uniref:DNA mismatch repair endonuclease MutL n=1 Tax=Rhodopila sp. TaxID=2480087 RepID=UPI003D0CA058